jgi:hypothetical protein
MRQASHQRHADRAIQEDVERKRVTAADAPLGLPELKAPQDANAAPPGICFRVQLS